MKDTSAKTYGENNGIHKLSKETQALVNKYGYLPPIKAKVRSDRNDSSWFRKTFQRNRK